MIDHLLFNSTAAVSLLVFPGWYPSLGLDWPEHGKSARKASALNALGWEALETLSINCPYCFTLYVHVTLLIHSDVPSLSPSDSNSSIPSTSSINNSATARNANTSPCNSVWSSPNRCLSIPPSLPPSINL